MRKVLVSTVWAILCLLTTPPAGVAQDTTVLDKLSLLPGKFFHRLQTRTSDIETSLTRRSEKYLRRLAKREARLRQKLSQTDSAGAARLFGNTNEQYETWIQKLKDTTAFTGPMKGEYLPYLDSLKGSLSFLEKEAGNLNGVSAASVKQALQHVQQLQGKLQQSEQIKAFIRQRRQQVSDYLSQYTHLPKSITKSLSDYNKEFYYYAQQVREYREMWKHPDQLQQKALTLLHKIPAFQEFMKTHSQLAGLFRVPGNYGNAASLSGLQTRSQVQQLIQNQLASGGPNASQLLQQNLQAAQGQLNKLKDKLNKLGGGSGDIDMPSFRPNDEKTKTFWKRLQYGSNLQTTRANGFFPTTTDLGLSVGYKLNNKSVIGIGGSYKIGWGKDIRHIALSGEGVGVRSFLDYQLKGSFYVSGGFEYNYQKPFEGAIPPSFGGGQGEVWQQSGLIGISKIVSMKSKLFKKTKLQLLWDFLSYDQVPRTQPVKFRVGYNF